MKFKLKRKEGTPTFRFSYKEYDVHRTLSSSSKWGYMFYVLDDKGEKFYFNMLDGQIDDDNGHLDAKNWEVIRIKEEKEMNEFKAGDKIRFKNNWGDVTAGKEYELIQECNFLMFIDDVGYPLHFYDLTDRCRTGIAADTELMEEEQTITKDFTGLKVGDKITCYMDDRDYWLKGKEYEVLENTTYFYRDCPFYIVDEDGDRRRFSVDEKGKLTYPELNDIFSWNKPEVEEEQKTDQVNNSKPAFVEVDITELLTAIEKDEKDKYYIYDSKKGTMKPVVWETNLHQLFNHLILRKEGK